jgi:TolB protein
MNMGNNEVKQLSRDPSPDYQPIFSPDGSQIAFISERDGDPDIWLINRDGSGLTQLLDRPEEQHLGAWSPDGQTILFIDHQQERSAGSDRSTIWKMTLADGTLRKLTDLGSINDAPVFSPHAQRIAFYSIRSGDFNMFTMGADGSAIIQLTHDALKAINPIYSPDCNWIIYGQLGGERIHQIPSTGGQASTLTTSPEIQALPTGWVTTSHQ